MNSYKIETDFYGFPAAVTFNWVVALGPSVGCFTSNMPVPVLCEPTLRLYDNTCLLAEIGLDCDDTLLSGKGVLNEGEVERVELLSGGQIIWSQSVVSPCGYIPDATPVEVSFRWRIAE